MKKQNQRLPSEQASTGNTFRKGTPMFKATRTAYVLPALLAGLLAGCGGSGGDNDPDPKDVPFTPTSTSADVGGSAVKGSLAGASVTVEPLKRVLLTLKSGGMTDQNGDMLLEVVSAPGFGLDTMFKVTVTADHDSTMVCDAAMCGTVTLGETVTGDQIDGTTLTTLGYVSVPYNSTADGTADTEIQATALSTIATSMIETAIADGRNVTSADLLALAQAEYSSRLLRAVGWDTTSANVFSMPIVSADSAENFVTGEECEDVPQVDENNEPVLDEEGNAVTEAVCSDILLGEASIKMSLINAAFAQFAVGSTQQAGLETAMANLAAAYAEEPDALEAFRQPIYDAIDANPVTAELGYTAADIIDMKLSLVEEAVSGGPMHLITTPENIASATISARSSISDNENETKLFDNDVETKWLDNEAVPTAEAPAWVEIGFAEPQAVNTLIITSANDAEARDAENFTVSASNDDGETWVTLTEVAGAAWDDRQTKQTFSFSNDLAYSTYRIDITKNKGGVELTQIAEIQMLGPVFVSVDHTDSTSFTASARGFIADAENQDKAFDNLSDTKWLDNTAVPTEADPTWIQADFATPVAVNQLAITSANDAQARDPENFSLLASNDDGVTWVTLGSWVGEAFDDRFQRKVFRASNELAYSSYRVNITKNAGNTDLMQLAEIELIGPELPSLNHAMGTGVVYTASGAISDAEAEGKAFDGDTATKWLDDSGVPTEEMPSWVQVDLPEAKAVNTLSITSANDAQARDPENFTLVASNDGGNTWVTLASFVGETFDDRFVRKDYRFANNLAYSTYRLNITKNAGGVELMQVAEIGLIGPQYSANDVTSASGTAFTARAAISDGESAPKAFDNDTETKWLDNGGVPSEADPSWVQVDLPAARVVSSMAITSANDAAARDPENFELWGSNDGGVTWEVVASFVGESWDDRYQRRSFDFANGLAYSTYRLNITKNAGGTDLMQISEIELIGLDQ